MALVTIAGTTVVGCSLDETTPVPRCHEWGSTLIVAQSTPGAALVPCLDESATGWQATRVHVDESGTTIRLQLGPNRRGSAEMSYSRSCRDEPGSRVESGIEGVEARALPAGGRRYTFEGGCLVVRIEGHADEAATEALVDSIVLLERDQLADDVRRTFIDENL